MNEEQLTPARQPALFDLSACERHLVELAGRDQERFTGGTTERDGELVSAVLDAVNAGVRYDQIARLAQVSKHTIQGIVERAERSGKIAPYKERMSRQLGRITEALAGQMLDDVEAGKIAPRDKGLMTAVLVDKKLLLDGEATSRVEHVERVRPEDVLAGIKRISAVEIEAKTEAN